MEKDSIIKINYRELSVMKFRFGDGFDNSRDRIKYIIYLPKQFTLYINL